MRFVLLIAILIISAAMAVTQHIALQNYWYWEYWWLDVVMHFAGGVVIALIGFVLTIRRALLLIGFVLVVGILWELFELLIGISLREPNFMFDTSLDLLMDTLGAVGAYVMIGGWKRASLSPSPAEHDESLDQTSL